MLGIVDPKKGTLRLSRLLILNVTALLVLSGLVAFDAIRPYPWMPIAVFALFVVNLVVVRRSHWQRLVVSDGRRRAVKLLLLPACVFTPAGIVAIVIWVRKRVAQSSRSMNSAVRD